jgi:hypothetical protein
MLRIGQKVTQVRDIRWVSINGEITPSFGVVYTIRTIHEVDGKPYLRFYEIKNQPRKYLDCDAEMAFGAWAFRPVCDRPTDISIFKKALEPGSIIAGMFMEAIEQTGVLRVIPPPPGYSRLI